MYLKEGKAAYSVARLFANAEWSERECWDMFGIPFNRHPDHRRILSDYGFSGYPLRKDFPTSGYDELYFDEDRGKIVKSAAEFMQEYRGQMFDNP